MCTPRVMFRFKLYCLFFQCVLLLIHLVPRLCMLNARLSKCPLLMLPHAAWGKDQPSLRVVYKMPINTVSLGARCPDEITSK